MSSCLGATQSENYRCNTIESEAMITIIIPVFVNRWRQRLRGQLFWHGSHVPYWHLNNALWRFLPKLVLPEWCRIPRHKCASRVGKQNVGQRNYLLEDIEIVLRHFRLGERPSAAVSGSIWLLFGCNPRPASFTVYFFETVHLMFEVWSAKDGLERLSFSRTIL